MERYDSVHAAKSRARQTNLRQRLVDDLAGGARQPDRHFRQLLDRELCRVSDVHGPNLEGAREGMAGNAVVSRGWTREEPCAARHDRTSDVRNTGLRSLVLNLNPRHLFNSHEKHNVVETRPSGKTYTRT